MSGVDSMKSLWMDIYRYIFIIVGEEKANTPSIKAATKTNTVQNNKFEKCQLFKFSASEWLQNRHKRQVRDTFEVGKLISN